ncbi:hypothetical protein [Dankookia sp. P2]|uniref:hypothetical protein n=1 Tax=Dankookia sp. P2 TaxID=3423955 RepID=UPI003D66B438
MGAGQLILGTQNDDAFGAGNGGDTIVGGPGNDYMVGGAGKDVFGFVPGDGPDWVANLASGSDTLLFGGGLTAANITTAPMTLAGVSGLGVKYGPGVADVVFLEAVTSLAAGDITFGTVPTVTADAPAFLTGTSGPDLARRRRGERHAARARRPRHAARRRRRRRDLRLCQ